ncbi:MAG: protein kinase [Bacteroidales bacterium]|nr:protein kinase [Bacteroidales bacterium]
MNDVSTSGPINGRFLSDSDSRTAYEEMPSRSFNRMVKAKRQGRWFILKGLKPEYKDQGVYLELLKKEYGLMVQLDHPNIVKAYAKEVNDTLGPCIVMEYIDGVRLDTFLTGKPSKAARRRVVDQLADALAYIHSKQILHRDLKPGNILVTRNGGNVKIIDFGLILRQVFPHRYSAVAAKCTRKDPDKRYESMETVRRALDRNDRLNRAVPFLGLGFSDSR